MKNESIEAVGNKPQPVIVHSVGKVGSKSIYNSLQALGTMDVLHTHQLNQNTITKFIENQGTPPHIRDSLYFIDQVEPDVPVKLITPVREPVARNISAFFGNLKRYGYKAPYEEIDIDELLNRFVNDYHHNIPADWFEEQYKKPLGIDVFSRSFGFERGATVIASGRFEALLLRMEDPNELREERIREFLGLKDFDLKSINVGDEKDYGDIYRTFKTRLILPLPFLDEMYSTKYVRHFYSDEEIEYYRTKWSLN